MNSTPRRRLFQQLLWSLGSALVVSFGLAAVVTITVGTRSLRASAQSELSGVAHTVHLSVESFIDARSSDLRLAAQAEAMDDVLTGDGDFRIQNALLDLKRATPGTYEELLVADRHGIIVAATRMERIGEPLPLALEPLGETADGNWLAGTPMSIPGTRERVLPMARPLHSRLAPGQTGWLIAMVRWRTVEEIVSGVLIAGRPQRKHAFALLYSNGVPIAGSTVWLPAAIHDRGMAHVRHGMRDETDVSPGEDAPPRRAGSDPHAADIGTAELWEVEVYRDSSEAFAVVRLFAWSSLAAGLLGLIVAAVVAFRLAQGFSGRIDALTQGTERLAAGDYAYRVQDERGDELALLADRFNHMAESLLAARRGIEQSNAELADSNQRLREASRLKDEFLANTSHELRTPLNGILGFLGLVTDGLCDDAEEERQSVRQAHACAQQLRTLIEDILDVSRIEAGRLTLSNKAVPVAEALGRIVAEMAPRAEARGLELKMEPAADEALAVRADARRLHQVLRHLVENAIKFTDHGSVTVRCVAPEAAGFVRIEVCDTGVGVKPERLAEVFDRFVQGDGSATRKFGGTGLGLSLVRDLIQMMGGVVQLHSAGEGLGTTVSFTLPLGWAATEARAPGNRPAVPDDRVLGPSTGPLVLLIEDDPALTTWLRAILHADGFRTALADSAERGWMLVRQLRPSLVLTDHALPASANARMRSGAELARHMAASRPTAEVPVILLSGHDPVAIEGEGALPRHAVTLRKPVHREELLTEVWRLVATNKPRPAHVLLAHQDPALLHLAQRAFTPDKIRVSIEPNDDSALESVRSQPRTFDVVLLESAATRVETLVLVRGFAELESAPPLVLLASRELTNDPAVAGELEAWPVLALLAKEDVLADPAGLCERLLQLARPNQELPGHSRAMAA
ncbi:MAG: ATP-binding protein [Candidatus Eisenbacteria bacterium]